MARRETTARELSPGKSYFVRYQRGSFCKNKRVIFGERVILFSANYPGIIAGGGQNNPIRGFVYNLNIFRVRFPQQNSKMRLRREPVGNCTHRLLGPPSYPSLFTIVPNLSAEFRELFFFLFDIEFFIPGPRVARKILRAHLEGHQLGRTCPPPPPPLPPSRPLNCDSYFKYSEPPEKI